MAIPKPTDDQWLLLAGIGYAVLFFALFPPLFASIDEYWYAQNAVNILHGHIEPASYPIGKSILLAPFALLGLGGLMLSGLVIHLVNFALLILILRRLKVRSIYALLYLFFPAFVYASRTLFSELFVLTLFLAGTYLFLSRNLRAYFASGLVFGLATLVRFDALIGSAAFGAGLLLPKPDFKNALAFAAGIIVGIFPLLVVNTLLYGGPLNSGYGNLGHVATAGLNLASVAANFILYGLLLVGLYLLIRVWEHFSKTRSVSTPAMEQLRAQGLNPWILVFLTVAYLAFNARFTSLFWFEFSPFTLFTARLRYLVPFIGLLIIPYAVIFARMETKKWFSRILPVVLVLLALSTVAGFAVHQKFLDTRLVTKEQIYAHTPLSSSVIGSADDRVYFLDGIDPTRAYFKVDDNSVTLPPNGFVIEVSYSNRQNDSSERGQANISERQPLKDFIAAHQGRLQLVFAIDYPNSLTIYHYS